MRRFVMPIMVLMSVFIIAVVSLVSGQNPTGVTAEAIGQANMRARPDINAEQVGEILNGTIYPALGRNEFFTWVLLGDPATQQPLGWVFGDLLTLTSGTIRDLPFSTVDVNNLAVSAATATATAPPSTAADGTAPTAIVLTPPAADATSAAPQATATPTLPPGIIGRAQGEINVRYGPGVQYTALRRAFAGDVFEVTATHSQFPWVQVRLEESPTGFAWIAEGLLEIDGNVATLPIISTTTFNLPALTPTPALRQAITLPGEEPIEISSAFAALGDRIWNTFLEANFVPEGGRFASLYIQDLQTGEAISFNSDVAYSGTSVNKIAVLAEYYATVDGPPTLREAEDIAKTMICSQNATTNDMLGLIGGSGFQSELYLEGAEAVTIFLRRLGLERTFLTAPYDARPNPEVVPTVPPRPIELPETDVDQGRANPNPSNQVTVDEIGLLLNAMYQCAYEEGGPLLNQFEGAFTPQECRAMLHVMANNTVDAFIKAGVPADVRVAHKHGWIADTHTNAGVVFTPGGDFIMVVAFYQPDTILFPETLPLAANASRAMYNYLNPSTPLEQPREGYIPGVDECNYGPGHPLVQEITDPGFLIENDPSLFYNPGDELADTVTATPTTQP